MALWGVPEKVHNFENAPKMTHKEEKYVER
jgi:hypothetical protein